MKVDTHAHLYWNSYQEDYDQVLERCQQADVKLIINIGTDYQTSQQAINIPSGNLTFYATIGYHPHESSVIPTDESIHEHIEKLKQLYQQNKQKIVGIGETGLDFYFHGNSDFTPSDISVDELKNLQHKLFRAHALLAKELGLPLIIHCREAWSEIFIPELTGTTGVFHTFSGTAEDAKRALDLGYYLSFSCILTYPKNQPLRDLVKDLPLDKIVTETDCPFLPPQQIRGQRNEPMYIQDVLKTIAQIKEISEKEVEEAVYQNTKRLFKI